MHSSRPHPDGSSNNAAEYYATFVRRVHQLIQFGYERLQPSDYVTTEEPAITGALVEAIDSVLDDCTEDWMSFFSVYDDPPVNDGRRTGKQRKRVDLRIDSSVSHPRDRFRFEAKRLGKGNSLAKYLGSEGLGCFLCGDYARDEDRAAMLGYVQDGELQSWGNGIEVKFSAAAAEYKVDSSHPFNPLAFSTNVSLQAYQSKHIRPSVGRMILIDHILMLFR